MDPDAPMIQIDPSPFSSLLAEYESQVTRPKSFNSVVVLLIEAELLLLISLLRTMFQLYLYTIPTTTNKFQSSL